MLELLLNDDMFRISKLLEITNFTMGVSIKRGLCERGVSLKGGLFEGGSLWSSSMAFWMKVAFCYGPFFFWCGLLLWPSGVCRAIKQGMVKVNMWVFILRRYKWHIHAGSWSLVNCWRGGSTLPYKGCS